jgi:hypothetical protein
MQYSDWSQLDSLFCPLLALQPQQQRAMLSSLMIDASLMMCSQLAAFFRLTPCEVKSDPQYTHTVSRSRTTSSSSAGIFHLFAMIIQHSSVDSYDRSRGDHSDNPSLDCWKSPVLTRFFATLVCVSGRGDPGFQAFRFFLDIRDFRKTAARRHGVSGVAKCSARGGRGSPGTSSNRRTDQMVSGLAECLRREGRRSS